MKQKKQASAEAVIRAGNRLVILLLVLAAGSTAVFMELSRRQPQIYEYLETVLPVLPLVFTAAAALVYSYTAGRLYEVLKAVSAETDRMADCILSGRKPGGTACGTLAQQAGIAAVQTDDGVFSRICDKLQKLSDAKALSIQRAKEETDAVHALISDISHQVKTPAANIKIYAGMLEKHMADAEGSGYLDVLRQQTDKLDFLMQTLVKMSRLETRVISLNIRSRKLLDILASALGAAVCAAEDKDIRLETDCEPGIFVAADEKWTAEAVFNVLDNAVKYTDRGGRITISAQPLQSYVSLEISDTGRGMRAEELPLIFQRFYRSPDVQDRPGAGLGLALAREILAAENGYLTASSKEGQGSCFRILLPGARQDLG